MKKTIFCLLLIIVSFAYVGGKNTLKSPLKVSSDPAAWLLCVDGWHLIEGLMCADVGLANPPEENLEQCMDVAYGAPEGWVQGGEVDELDIKTVEGTRQLWVRVGSTWYKISNILNPEIQENDLTVYVGEEQ